jgi:hypothetical protein
VEPVNPDNGAPNLRAACNPSPMHG